MRRKSILAKEKKFTNLKVKTFRKSQFEWKNSERKLVKINVGIGFANWGIFFNAFYDYLLPQ